MENKLTNNLTTGSILPQILKFAIPIIIGNLFQNLYNLADTVIVGRLLGLESLAAVGATGAVNFLIIGFVNGTSAGMAIPVAQRFGAGDDESMRQYVSNSVYVAAAISLIMTPLMVIFTKSIMAMMLTPADIMDEAALYIAVIFAGIPAIFTYNLASGVIRALGDSKTPLYFLLFSSVLNIGLDLISVLIFKMDVRGPALATVLSQAVSGIMCIVYMRKKYPVLRMSKENLKLSGKKVRNLLTTGVPMGLQYSITAIGSVILQASVNTLGSVAVAAVTVASRINMIIGNCEMDSLGTAMATYAGQNYGAGKYDRITEGAKKAVMAGCIYAIAAFGLMFLFGMQLEKLFITDAQSAQEVLMLARKQTLINSSFYSMLCILSVLRFSLQGLGYSFTALWAGVAEMAARMIIGLILVPVFGYTAVCFANGLAWLFADVTLIACWIPIMKKVKATLRA